jgi:manganese transport protein
MDARTTEIDPCAPDWGTAPNEDGWRADAAAGIQPSLSTILVPLGGHWVRRLLAFLGPGYLVSVGYMDPGNWATDLAGGSKLAYTLLSVILLSNLMAILLQALAARLGIVTDRDLAQACRASFSRPVNFLLWLACEAAIIRPRSRRSHRHRDRTQIAVRHSPDRRPPRWHGSWLRSSWH